MKRKLTMILAGLFLSIGMALAQTSITGTVVSQEDGQPVIGATVRVPGSNTGAVTDVDGKFTISAPQGAELSVSYIGMKTITVKAANNMKVTLEPDDASLDELVVVGYGSARKLGTVAGSVATVGGEKLTNRPVANVGDAMQGQVAGLQVFTSSGEPSSTSMMTIRGVSSVNAGTTPLYILDGSEISAATFLALNPNDIENMTVLKDASSTAIYGSRAANGVIIITTKKGKFGEAPTVTVSAQYGISQIAHKGMDMMDANQYLDFLQMVTPSLAQDANFQAQKAFYKKYNIGTDWYDELLGGTAPTWQADVSVRGGSQSVAYLFSYGHFDQAGLFDDSEMRRESLRANLEVNITPWLKMGTNTNLAYNKMRTTSWGDTQNSVYNRSYAALNYLPIQPTREILGLVYDQNGSIDWQNSTFKGYGDRLDAYTMLYGGQIWSPHYVSDMQPQWDTRVSVNENLFVNINPINGLNIRSAVGLDAYDARSTIINYRDPNNPNFQTGGRGESFSRYYRWTVTNTAEYKFNLFKKHNISVLLGQESQINKSDGFGLTVQGFSDNRLITLTAASIEDVQAIAQSISEEVRNSWFGTLNYSYSDKYFVDLSIRRDGSSLFGENNRWATFGAGAVMWDIAKENFMKSTRSWLNNLQAKVSYGTTGNSSIDAYLALGLVGVSGSYDGQPGTAISNPGNPDLTWETVKTLNIALTGRLFNRLDFSVEYYDKVTSDMLMQIPYSFTTGFTGGWGNVAEMYNRGVDFSLAVDIINNKDWYWNVSVNGNYNKNKITKLFQGLNSYTMSDYGYRMEVGHPFGEFYLVRWSHVDPADGQNVWLDKDGNYTKVYSDADQVMMGKSWIAPWSGGINTTLAWKGLQLDVQFTGMFDRYMLNIDRGTVENASQVSNSNQSVDMFNMWQKPGDITNIPAANASVYNDSHILENASFVRLKFLQLSYTLPKKWMDASGFIKDAKVFFVGRNLLTFTPYKGYDPEVMSNGTQGVYPNTRQFSFGAQLTF